jgi:hypothetical protein
MEACTAQIMLVGVFLEIQITFIQIKLRGKQAAQTFGQNMFLTLTPQPDTHEQQASDDTPRRSLTPRRVV